MNQHISSFGLAPEWDAAALIAQLASQSTIPAAEIETLRELLATQPPARIITALNIAVLEQAEQGNPMPLLDADAFSFQMMLDGLRHLAQIASPATYLAAA